MNAAPPRHILVRGVNWLGDAVMTTPALARLRERFPEARLALLTHEKLRELWQHHPDVDEVLTFRAGESVFSVARRLRGPGFVAGLQSGLQAFSAEVVQVQKGLWASGSPSEPAPAVRNDLATEMERLQHAARRQRFDLAIVLPNSPRSALETWLARIPLRIGYARPGRNWCLTQAVPSRPNRVVMRKRSFAEVRRLLAAPPEHSHSQAAPAASAHQAHEYLHLVAALGACPEPLPPLLHVTTDEVAAATHRFSLTTEPDAPPLIGLNPGAEYGPAKRWPIEHFAATAVAVQKRIPCRWLILGGPRDADLAANLEARLRSSASGIHNVSAQTSLRELMALLRLCEVVLTNDTGPMHLAAALGTPVVVPFGSTSPELTGPGLPGDPRHRLLRQPVPCAPCFLRECPVDLRCLRGITPEMAAAAILDCLAR
jgi:heptosyltransferase-2